MGQPVSGLQVPGSGQLAAISAPYGLDPLPVFVAPIMLGNGNWAAHPFSDPPDVRVSGWWPEGLSEHHLDVVFARVVDQGDKRFYR